VYKTLFVNSVGFYDTIEQLYSDNALSETLKSRTWIIYTILLEYCCPLEYNNAIGNITKYYKMEMDKQTASIIKEKEELKIDNEKLKERIM